MSGVMISDKTPNDSTAARMVARMVDPLFRLF
jgi:hypothetical protein